MRRQPLTGRAELCAYRIFRTKNVQFGTDDIRRESSNKGMSNELTARPVCPACNSTKVGTLAKEITKNTAWRCASCGDTFRAPLQDNGVAKSTTYPRQTENRIAEPNE